MAVQKQRTIVRKTSLVYSHNPPGSTFAPSCNETLLTQSNPVSQLGKGTDVGGPFSHFVQRVRGGTLLDISCVPGSPPPWGSVKTTQFAKRNVWSSGDFSSSAAPSNSQLDAAGTTAIARCLPSNSVADLSVFLGEIMREGIPNIIGSGLLKEKARVGRGAGNEYLNYQFGWAPMVSEMRSFAQAVVNREKILAQYARDANKPIRRRYEYPIETTWTDLGTYSGRALPILADVFYPSGHSGSMQKGYGERQVSHRTWFAGAFTYPLNMGNGALDKAHRIAQEAKKLLGLNLTPETVWNLAPWSWAVDWFTNLGDIIHNVSASLFDGVVMNYGYVMKETITTNRWVLNNVAYNGKAAMTLVQEFETVRQSRRPATPFGFGFNMDSLSTRQIAIMAALGLSRS